MCVNKLTVMTKMTASVARVEELAREINALRKGKAKRPSKPAGLHLTSLQCFHSLISIGLSDRTPPSLRPSCPSSTAQVNRNPPGSCCPWPHAARGRPPRRVDHGPVGRSQEGFAGPERQEAARSHLAEMWSDQPPREACD